MYKKLLADRNISDGQRDVIGNMLAEEEAKLLTLFSSATSGAVFMDRFVARANIDHYLGLLDDSGLALEKRATVTKLLIQEEDSLAHDIEQLEFAETRAASGRGRLNDMRCKLDLSEPEHRAQAERLVAIFEATQNLLDGFCHRLRNKANNRG